MELFSDIWKFIVARKNSGWRPSLWCFLPFAVLIVFEEEVRWLHSFIRCFKCYLSRRHIPKPCCCSSRFRRMGVLQWTLQMAVALWRPAADFVFVWHVEFNYSPPLDETWALPWSGNHTINSGSVLLPPSFTAGPAFAFAKERPSEAEK